MQVYLFIYCVVRYSVTVGESSVACMKVNILFVCFVLLFCVRVVSQLFMAGHCVVSCPWGS